MLPMFARRARVAMPSCVSRALVLAVLLVLLEERGARAADACIDEPARRAVLSCDGFPEVARASAPPRASPSVHLHGVKPEERPLRSSSARPAAPSEPPPEARGRRIQVRREGMLVVEIQSLEQLFSTTPRGASDRVTIARRLAEDYAELESAALREKTSAEIARDVERRRDAARAGALQTQANAAEAVVRSARQKALAYYALVKNEYPAYPDLDTVLYYMAYEHEGARDLESARRSYFELISKRPDSKYVPRAYFAFGEMFFEEGQGDPSKLDLAAQAYQKVLSFPPPENAVFGYAHDKLAYVHWIQGDFPHAMGEFKKVIDYGVAFSALPGAAKLEESARRDIVQVYALAGDPARAFGFFKGVAGDDAGSTTRTLAMMNELGLALLDTGHYPEAIAVFRELSSRDRSGPVCEYQAHITHATLALHGSDKGAVVAELENQVRALTDTRASDKTDDAKRACANETAALLTESAIGYHLEAVGTPGQRGTGDPRTTKLAALLYRRALETFTKEELASFKYPRLVREDWPTAHSMKVALADILYTDEKWRECGPAFEAVVDDDPRAPDGAESAYAAALCYQRAFDADHARGEAARGAPAGTTARHGAPARPASSRDGLAPRALSDAERVMLRAFDRYACTQRPEATDVAGRAQLCDVKFARARTYFEAHHFAEAAAAFRDIADGACDGGAGIYAAQLYLESMNVLATHGEPACFAEMRADIPKLEEIHCRGDAKKRNAEACVSLGVVAVDLARKEAEAKVARADRMKNDASLGEYAAAGTIFFDLFRTHCQAPAAEGREATASRCDEIGYDAAKAFQAARLMAKAIAARKALIELDAKTSAHSPLAQKAMLEIGRNFQAIAVYELAAEWLERYAAAAPRANDADVALSDAVVLRLGLGQDDRAIADAASFARAYGAQKPKEAALVAFAVGAHYAEKGEWEKADHELSRAMGLIDGAASLDVMVLAHAALARVRSHLRGGESASRADYAKVRALWKDPADAESRVRAAYPDEPRPAQDKRITRALDAVAEAYFAEAEDARRADVLPLTFPLYRGPGTREDVQAFVEERVRAWYTRKMNAIARVEASYFRVLDLRPRSFEATAPPRWSIAAGSRAGLMWGAFVDDFRRAPIPVAWRGTVLEQIYTRGIDEASEPYKVRRAKPALKKCLDLAVQFQYFDEHARACEEWLAKNYKAEYHVVDELRAAPSLVNSGLEERMPAAR